MPEHLLEKLGSEFHCVPSRHSGREFQALVDQVDAVYITPNQPHQLSLFTELRSEKDRHKIIRKIDALYMTRAQTERFREGSAQSQEGYPRVDEEVLSSPKFREALVMHPLPRRGEIPYQVDQDPRSVYFKQAQVGVPIRMALIAILLGSRRLQAAEKSQERQPSQVIRDSQAVCVNSNCISRTEEGAYVTPEFEVSGELPLRCAYCEADQEMPEKVCDGAGER